MNIWPNAIYITPKSYDFIQTLLHINMYIQPGKKWIHIPPEATSVFLRAASSVDGSE